MRHLRSVYPRVCGGTTTLNGTNSVYRGLSPRVRGNRHPPVVVTRRAGSIPACAGEPEDGLALTASSRVYPRVCGGTAAQAGAHCPDEGLSPRVRGNHAEQGHISRAKRSIPACAGEPRDAADGRGRRTVYPRVCGGTGSPPWSLLFTGGLSPRVRGNPGRRMAAAGGRGSIPACAGEPGPAVVSVAVRSVYPRVCGGTGIVTAAIK